MLLGHEWHLGALNCCARATSIAIGRIGWLHPKVAAVVLTVRPLNGRDCSAFLWHLLSIGLIKVEVASGCYQRNLLLKLLLLSSY